MTYLIGQQAAGLTDITYADRKAISDQLYSMQVHAMLEDYVILADTIGIIAGILVLSSFIPQLYKAYKTKKMQDVSIYLMSLIASGMFLWVIYGLIRKDPVIIGTNISGFILNIILIALKVRYDELQRV